MENKEKFVLPVIEVISVDTDSILTGSLGDDYLYGYYRDDDILG